MAQHGFNFKFGGKEVNIDKPNGTLLGKAKIIRGLYRLNLPRKSSAFIADHHPENRAYLWHQRLGHCNYKTLHDGVKNNILTGVKITKKEWNKAELECPTCAKCKITRRTKPKKAKNRAKKPLYRVCADLLGPVEPMTQNKCEYALVMIDDFSRYAWVRFLREKSDTKKAVTDFIKIIENTHQDIGKIAVFRSDAGAGSSSTVN